MKRVSVLLLVALLAVLAVIAVSTSLSAQSPGLLGGGVIITDSEFIPSVITIPIRSAVVWTNTGALSHSVTAVRGEFGSGVIPPGGTYSYLFDAPGEYHYIDLFSPATGRVVVGEGVFRVYLPLVMR